MCYSDLCECSKTIIEIMKTVTGIEITKALDPNNEDDFIIITERLAQAINDISGPVHDAVLEDIINALDVDWSNSSPFVRNQLIKETSELIGGIPGQTIDSIRHSLTAVGEETVRGCKRSIKETLSADIGVSFDLLDQKIVDYLADSNIFYVTNQYGNISDVYTRKAKKIVARGLRDGISDLEIAEELAAMAGSALGPSRSINYWRIISNVFVGRSRTYSNLSSMSEAGITIYVWDSVMDERTTEYCVFMHEREFSVADALSKYESLADSNDPTAIVSAFPFGRATKNSAGEDVLVVNDGSGGTIEIARIDEFGSGVADRRGSYSNINVEVVSSLPACPAHIL